MLTLIILISCLSGIGSDIYSPSLPEIAQELNVTINKSQFSMVIYLLGGLSTGLISGWVSDYVGRKKPLIFGLILFIIGCMLSIISDNILSLYLGRFLQGAGAGINAALWRAIFQDQYTEKDISKYAGYLSSVKTFVIPSAPLLGSYLQHYLGWRSNFIFLAIYGASILIWISSWSPKHTSKEKMQLSSIFAPIKNRVFRNYVFCSLTALGALFSWLVIGPILVIEKMNLSALFFGWLNTLGPGFALIISSFVNAKLLKTQSVDYVLSIGIKIMLISGLSLLIGYTVFGLNLMAVIVPISLFYFGCGLLFTNCFAKAFSTLEKEITGAASAIYSFCQALGSAIFGALSSLIHEENQLPLAIIVFASASICFFITNQTRRK